MNRRTFLAVTGASLAHASVPRLAWESGADKRARTDRTAADFKLRIEPCRLQIGRGIYIKTVAYNGQVPGPTLSLKPDRPVSIDVTNATENPDIVHWHGLRSDTLNDGAVEEGSLLIAPGATLRYHFNSNPSGTRWYHSHAMAMDNLSLAGYTANSGSCW